MRRFGKQNAEQEAAGGTKHSKRGGKKLWENAHRFTYKHQHESSLTDHAPTPTNPQRPMRLDLHKAEDATCKPTDRMKQALRVLGLKTTFQGPHALAQSPPSPEVAYVRHEVLLRLKHHAPERLRHPAAQHNVVRQLGRLAQRSSGVPRGVAGTKHVALDEGS